MNRNTTVVVNACATYARLLFTAGLGLLSGRWILAGLGEVDYGLFAVVGGVMGFLTFVNSCLAGSAQRHFAYAIGQGDVEEVRRWFNASLSIHLCLATTVVVVGLPVGDWLLQRVLNIPPERMATCLWVFRCTLLSAFFSIAAVPFTGMFTARQLLLELAVFNVVGSVLTVLLAHTLLGFAGDRLLLYAIGMTGITLTILVAQMVRLRLAVPECRVRWRYWWDRLRMRELTSFAGWTLFSTIGNLGRSQGMVLLMNVFCGARMNSALGVANQIAGQTENISQGLFGALAPEITTSEGRGERDRMISLALRASKFSVLLTMMAIIPLIAEMDGVLKLWLREVPAHAGTFCRIVLLTFFVDKLSTGYTVAVFAYGRIAVYQATLGGLLILTLPLAWLVLRAGGSPEAALGCSLLTGAACTLGRVFWVRHLLGVPVGRWLRNVVARCAVVAVPTVVLVGAVCVWTPPSTLRLLLVLPGSAAVVCLFAWLVGLDHVERAFVMTGVRRVVGRLCPAGAGTQV